jgi:hypothetical protein
MSKSEYFKKEAERKEKSWIRVQQQFEKLKAKTCDTAEFEKKFPKQTKLLSSIFNAKDPAELATALYEYYEAENGFDDYYDTKEFGSYAESVSYDIENYFTDEDREEECEDKPAYGQAIITDKDWGQLGLGDLIEGQCDEDDDDEDDEDEEDEDDEDEEDEDDEEKGNLVIEDDNMFGRPSTRDNYYGSE